jgi:hypothetical protein
MTTEVKEAFSRMVEEGSLTAEGAKARFTEWLIGPVSDDTLDDFEDRER